MVHTLLRLAALLGHIVLNVILIAWITSYDISGSWVGFILFLLAVTLMLFLLIRHLLLFIHYLKNKSR